VNHLKQDPSWQVQEPFGRDWEEQVVAVPAQVVVPSSGPLHVEIDGGASRPAQRGADGIVRFADGLPAGSMRSYRLASGVAEGGLRTRPAPEIAGEASPEGHAVEGRAAGMAWSSDGDPAALRGSDGAWKPLRLSWDGATQRRQVSFEAGAVCAALVQEARLDEGPTLRLTWALDDASPLLQLTLEQEGQATGALHLHLGELLPPPRHAYWRPHSPAPWRGPPGRVHKRQCYEIPPTGDDLQIGPFYNWEKDAAAFWTAWSDDGADVLFVAWAGSSHTHVAEGVERLDLCVRPQEGRLDLRIPLQAGRRRLALGLLPRTATTMQVDGPPATADRLHARLHGVGLPELHAMSLDVADPHGGRYPRLWLDPDDLPAVRSRLRDWTWLRERFEAHVDDEFLDTHDAPDMRVDGRRLGRDDAGAWLAAGDDERAARALTALWQELDGIVQELLDYGPTCDGTLGISLARRWRALVLNLDLVLGSAAADGATRAEVRRRLAFVAEVQCTDDAWPATGSGIARGNQNFHPDVVSARGLAAALLDGHPAQDRWLRAAVDEMTDYLNGYHEPSGMSRESATYQFASLAYALQLHAAAVRRGHGGLADLPSLRRSLTFLAATQTPVDERCGHRMLPTVGHVTVHHWCQSLQAIFGWAAKATAASDPAFSARMMAAWKRGGAFVFSLHDVFQGMIWSPPLLLLDPELPAGDDGDLAGSRTHGGFGAVLRSRHADSEGYVAWKMGQCVGHFDQDEGSFLWYAYGQPLLADFGCQYNPNFHAHPWLHNRISIDHRADGPPRGGRLTQHEEAEGFDLVAGEVRVRSLFFHGEWPERDPAHDVRHAGDPVPIAEHLWRRQLLYVHALEAIVLVDRIDGDLPTDWNLQVLAESARLDASGARFAGQRGIDLDVALVTPTEPRLEVSAFAHAGWDETRLPHLWWRGFRWTAPSGTTMSAMAEQALTLRAHADPGQSYCAVLSACPRQEDGRLRNTPGEATVTVGDDWLAVAATDEGVVDVHLHLSGQARRLRL
jgi:hypothetical protein